ncbi:MAG: MFS transporter [Chloroflexota bacterium]
MLTARLADRPFVLSCFAGFFAALSFALATVPALPLLALAKGTPLSALGIIVAAPLVTAAVVLRVRPRLAAGDRRWLALAGMAAAALISLLYPVAASTWQLLLLRLGHGVALALVPAYATITAADAIEETGRGRLLAGPAVAGWAVGPLAGGLIAEVGGPTAPFLWAFGCAALAAVALAFLPAARLADAAVDIPTPGGRSVAGPATLRMVFGCVEAFLPVFALDLGLGARQTGMLFAVWMAWAAVSGPLLTGLIYRSPGGTLVIGLLVGSLATAGLGMAVEFYSAVLAMVALGLATAAVYGGARPQLAYDGGSPLHHARGLAVPRFAHAAGPMAAGLLLPVVGTAGTFLLAGIALAAAALVTAAFLPASSLAGKARTGHL